MLIYPQSIGVLLSGSWVLLQLLLGPIVSQLLVEPPIEDSSDIILTEWATVRQMDDTLVSCLGQMALTAGTDLLWKPLNHEVLMCSRSEKVRPRLLALRVVKLLAEQLKEEFLVLLPETLPFLAELLEDADLNVVANTQGVIKNLEDLSGENLAQYF
jgi:U3 small nucleolar RNA-associated protein 10